MRCFITGVGGFMGSAVAKELLARGHEVIGLTSSKGKLDTLIAQGIRPILGDIRRPQEWIDVVRDAEAVIHLATLPIPNRPGKRYLQDLVEAQETVLRHTLDTVSGKCKVFIYTSGITVYGPSSEGKTETSPLNPYRIAIPYAAGERLVLEAVNNRGIPGIVLRPGGVYGFGGIFGRFWADPIAAGKRTAFPGNGRQLMSFVHIDDCAQAFVTCVENPLPGEIFNVADNEPVPVGTIIKSLAEEMGAPEPFGIPAPLFRLVAGPIVAEMLLSNKVASNRKLIEVLGMTLQYPTFREGIPALARSARRVS